MPVIIETFSQGFTKGEPAPRMTALLSGDINLTVPEDMWLYLGTQDQRVYAMVYNVRDLGYYMKELFLPRR